MKSFDETHIEKLLNAKHEALLHVYTLGRFNITLDHQEISDNWGRDKAIQLFQFFVISRNRMALHKEVIIDRLWEEKGTDQHFKVALHEIKKILEPKGSSKTTAKYIQRQGSSYKLNMENIWLDSQVFKSLVELANNVIGQADELAILAYQEAVRLYQGIFLPNRIYEDWTSSERDHLQLLALNAYVSLSELLLQEQANESIRLTEEALNIDPTWEEAYRIQMKAHMANGNRPQAMRCFDKCKQVLDKEFGIEPLPATSLLYKRIKTT